MRELVIGGKYRHFKGGEYLVVGTARHSETGETLVLYRPVNESGLWARPISMFLSDADGEKYPEAKGQPRFRLIED